MLRYSQSCCLRSSDLSSAAVHPAALDLQVESPTGASLRGASVSCPDEAVELHRSNFHASPLGRCDTLMAVIRDMLSEHCSHRRVTDQNVPSHPAAGQVQGTVSLKGYDDDDH